jgi:hypothetical protein
MYYLQHICDSKVVEGRPVTEWDDFQLTQPFKDRNASVAVCANCRERFVVIDPSAFDRANGLERGGRHALNGQPGFAIPGRTH